MLALHPIYTFPAQRSGLVNVASHSVQPITTLDKHICVTMRWRLRTVYDLMNWGNSYCFSKSSSWTHVREKTWALMRNPSVKPANSSLYLGVTLPTALISRSHIWITNMSWFSGNPSKPSQTHKCANHPLLDVVLVDSAWARYFTRVIA